MGVIGTNLANYGAPCTVPCFFFFRIHGTHLLFHPIQAALWTPWTWSTYRLRVLELPVALRQGLGESKGRAERAGRLMGVIR